MNPKPEKSRLGDLLVDMRLVDQETLQQALADQRAHGVRLATALAQRRVLDEERLTKAVAARLGLEAVSVANHKIHERVLNLIPHAVAKRFGVLPIAIKRTQQAEVLYLVMVDPLNTEALGEVQRITGRQIRVLMATASELDQCIEAQYRELDAKLAASGSRPPRVVASRPPGPSKTPPPASVRPARRVSVPGLPPRVPSVASRPPAPAGIPGQPVSSAQRPFAPASVPGVVPSSAPMPRAPAPRPEEPRPPRTPPPTAPEVSRGPPASTLPVTPALTPSPLPKTSPVGRPLNLDNPATLIDTARPAEIRGLSEQLGAASAPVMPSDLDPPDSVATRVEAEPFTAPAEPAPPARVSAPNMDWDIGGAAWDAPADSWGALADAALEVEAESASLDDQWAQATGLDMEPPPDMQEDIATSQLELSDENKAALLGGFGTARPPDRRALASTMEVPVDLDEEPNPFEQGPGLGDIPVGLERTGIFPAVDLEGDEFEPPDLSAGGAGGGLGSLSDIPDSEAAVRARFGEPGKLEDDDAIEAIEEVVLEPLDDEVPAEDEPIEVDGLDDEPIEVDADEIVPAEPPPTSPPRPAEAEVPVIEPSSLVSLMDEDASENEDTGSAEAPLPPPVPPAPTRVFDEADRADQPPTRGRVSPAAETEEPTNPRMEAPSVSSGVRETMIDAPAPPQLAGRMQGPSLASMATTLADQDAPPMPIGPITPAPMPSEADTGDTEQATEAAVPTARPRQSPITEEEPAPEEPTPAQDPLERSDVLDALAGAFVPRAASSVEPAALPRDDTPAERNEEAASMVARLLDGESLNSAERAQLLLAVTRLLVSKGIISREALISALSSDR